MGRKAARQQTALRRPRERRLAEAETAAATSAERARAKPVIGSATSRRSGLTCSWCNGPITPSGRGRIPKWCSAACRQRAWEQSRAAASGRAAVEIVERRVPVPVEVIVFDRYGQQPLHGQWASLLRQLATQLDSGAVYDRDMPKLADACRNLDEALNRRQRS